jgi:hypothetical protein
VKFLAPQTVCRSTARRNEVARSTALGIAVAMFAAVAAACSGSTTSQRRDPPPADAWLSAIGTGPAQTARVCDRGARDRVATALCGGSIPPIRSLDDLYVALRLGQPAERLVAATTHSLGLSARTVSAANPRVLVFPNAISFSEPLDYTQVVAAGFTRGEQLVELVGLDPITYEYNFYLLSFEQRCTFDGCTPEQLLTEKIESDWTGWTLYSDHDLVDTPLDCASCHLPFGADSHKLLLMRQVADPWMHWGDFRRLTERMCPDAPGTDAGSDDEVTTTDGLDLLLALEGQAGRYAGIPVRELHEALSGDVFSDFLVDAENLVRGSPYQNSAYPYEQLVFRTREVLCERFRTGTSPTWEAERRESSSRGLPEPFYGPDVLDATLRAEIVSDRADFLQQRADRSAFEVGASLIAADAASAVGFVPREEDTAPDILRGLCVRCHAASTDPRLRRARFDVEKLDAVEPATFQAVTRRLRLPRSSPELMPPLRVGELPPWAIERVEKYLSERCTTPGACE